MPCGFHWLPCWRSAVGLESFPAKEAMSQVALWSVQQWPSRCFLFFLAQVSQYSIDDVLVLDTGDDPDRSAATATTSISMLKTRLSRCAQVMAA